MKYYDPRIIDGTLFIPQSVGDDLRRVLYGTGTFPLPRKLLQAVNVPTGPTGQHLLDL